MKKDSIQVITKYIIFVVVNVYAIRSEFTHYNIVIYDTAEPQFYQRPL